METCKVTAKSPHCITSNLLWDLKICAHLCSLKVFLLSYAMNWIAAVIRCNLRGINIAFFSLLLALLPFLSLLLFGCCSSTPFPFTSGCLWDLVIRALGAVLLIRLRNLSSCVHREWGKKKPWVMSSSSPNHKPPCASHRLNR